MEYNNNQMIPHKREPIIIVEDDIDDKEMLEHIIKELEIPNNILWFDNTDLAYEYLSTTKQKTFIIFCDINLPGKNGLEFKRQIDQDPILRKDSIPFIFLSTSARQHDINEAYTKMVVQGFFIKGSDYNQMKREIKVIFDYWYLSKHPE